MSTHPPPTTDVSFEEVLHHLTEAVEHALTALRLAPGVPSSPSSPDRSGAPAGSVRSLEFGERLTEREATILRLLPTRLSQREIARELYVSVNTVKSHCRRIYRKLGVAGRRAAVDHARHVGLLPLP
jgi:DNA-binding CsgD family transcriptional regulator